MLWKKQQFYKKISISLNYKMVRLIQDQRMGIHGRMDTVMSMSKHSHELLETAIEAYLPAK